MGTPIPLDPTQKALVETPPTGILLGEARAGSGKTRTIRARTQFILRWRDQEINQFTTQGVTTLAKLLGQAQGSRSKVLILAYGKAVAKEIKEALSQELSADDVKRVTVKTFHGIAASLLHQFSAQTPLAGQPYDIPKRAILLQRMADWETCRLQGLGVDRISLLLQLEAYANVRGQTVADVFEQGDGFQAQLKALAMGPDVAWQWIAQLREYRYRNGILTFDDLMPLALDLPDTCYQAQGFVDVIADELQDLNYPQRELVKRFMGTAKSFTGLGDPFQAIFSWNGADSQIFEHFRDTYRQRGPQTQYLLTNYRCPEPVIQVANQILAKDLDTDKLITGTGRSGPPVRLTTEGITGLVQFLQERKGAGVPWKAMAVAYRTRAQSRALEMGLAEVGIPYRMKDGAFFAQREIVDLLAYVDLACNPVPDYDCWRRIISHRQGLGVVVAELAWGDTQGRPLSIPGYKPKCLQNRILASRAWESLKEDWASYLEVLQKEGLVGFLLNLKADLLPHWLETTGDDSRFGDRLETVNAFLNWVEGFGPEVTGLDVLEAVEAYETGGQSQDQNADAVVLGTAHGFKGLEYDTFVLWNVAKGQFPIRTGNVEEAAAENRLLYVAVTRATEALAIVCPDENSLEEVALCRYIPQGLGHDPASAPDCYLDAA